MESMELEELARPDDHRAMVAPRHPVDSESPVQVVLLPEEVEVLDLPFLRYRHPYS